MNSGSSVGEQLALGLLELLPAELDHELAGRQAVGALQVVVEVAEVDAQPFGGQAAHGALPRAGRADEDQDGTGDGHGHHRSWSALR